MSIESSGPVGNDTFATSPTSFPNKACATGDSFEILYSNGLASALPTIL